MVTMIATAQKLDWRAWTLGWIGALISGGAGAIGVGFGAAVVDPEHFNVTNGGLHHLGEVMAISFVISGIVSMAKYLQIHPVPVPVTINMQGGDVTIKHGDSVPGAPE